MAFSRLLKNKNAAHAPWFMLNVETEQQKTTRVGQQTQKTMTGSLSNTWEIVIYRRGNTTFLTCSKQDIHKPKLELQYSLVHCGIPISAVLNKYNSVKWPARMSHLLVTALLYARRAAVTASSVPGAA